jgi:hypothetical protein
MNNFSVISFLFLIGMSPLFSQGQSTRFQLGIEGGPSLSMLRYDLFFFPSKYVEAGPGGAIGLTIKYNINNRLALKTNLSYEMKGNTRTGDPDYRLNYITLPMLLQVKFGKSPLFFMNIGPYVGYLLPLASNTDYYYKPFDMGISMGVGLEIPVSHQFSLNFEIRNNVGLVNISRNATYNKHGNPVVEIGDLYTHSIVGQVGFVCNIGPKGANE